LAKGELDVPLKTFTLRLDLGFEQNKNPPLPVESHKS